jgi:hypothetical protein
VAQPPNPAVDALSPAHAWIGLKNSDDVGTNFDLLAEVFRNGVLIGSGEVDNVPGGSSGFKNAKDRAIALALPAPGKSGACAGDTLSIKLSVRVTAVGCHRSGTARLWYNDSAANSRFGATIGGGLLETFGAWPGACDLPLRGTGSCSNVASADTAAGGTRSSPDGVGVLASLLVLASIAGLLWLLCWIWPTLKHSASRG